MLETLGVCMIEFFVCYDSACIILATTLDYKDGSTDSMSHCQFNLCTPGKTETHPMDLHRGEPLLMHDSDIATLKDDLCDPQSLKTRSLEQSVIMADVIDLKKKTGLLHNTMREVLSPVPNIIHTLADYLESNENESNPNFDDKYSKIRSSLCTLVDVDIIREIYDRATITNGDHLELAQHAFCAYDQSLRTMLLRRIRAFPGGWKYGEFGDSENKLRIKYETASLTENTHTLESVQKTLKSVLKIHPDVHIRLILTRDGCVEVLFALFTVPKKKDEKLLPEELSIQQKRDLARHSISLLEYNCKVLYCCCMLTDDQVTMCSLTKGTGIYTNFFHT